MKKYLISLYYILMLVSLNSCFSSSELYNDLPRLEQHDFLELDQVHYLIDGNYNYSKRIMPDSLINNPISDTLRNISRSRISRLLKIEDSLLVNEIQVALLNLQPLFINAPRLPSVEIPHPIKVYMDSIESDYLMVGWHYSCKKNIDAIIKDVTSSALVGLITLGTIIPVDQGQWTHVTLYLFDRKKNTLIYYNQGEYSEKLKISDKRLNKDFVSLLKKLYLNAI